MKKLNADDPKKRPIYAKTLQELNDAINNSSHGQTIYVHLNAQKELINQCSSNGGWELKNER